MATYHQYVSITGSANATVEDSGFSSTTEERRHLDAVLMYVSGYADNKIVGYLDRDKVFEIPDYVLLTDASSGSTNVQYATNRIAEIPVDIDVPVGKTFKLAITCGATAKDVRGAYRYHIV